MAAILGSERVTGAMNRTIRALITEGRIALTIPDKPNIRLQRYRLVPSGEAGARGSARLGGQYAS